MAGIVRMQKGEVLITVKSDKNINRLNEAITQALKGKVEVKTLTSYKSVQIRNIDEVEEKAEISEAFNGTADENVIKEEHCRLIKGYKGPKTAIVRLRDSAANELIRKENLSIE